MGLRNTGPALAPNYGRFEVLQISSLWPKRLRPSERERRTLRNTITSSRTRPFFKGVVCPSSQSLLAYRSDSLPAGYAKSVETHLASCDFCNAELQLLTRYRGSHEEFVSIEMPWQLRQLAERLLNRGDLYAGSLKRGS